MEGLRYHLAYIGFITEIVRSTIGGFCTVKGYDYSETFLFFFERTID